jgi:hypothetical protein
MFLHNGLKTTPVLGLCQPVGEDAHALELDAAVQVQIR